MNVQSFRFHAISWLRDDMNVDTDCLPHEEIEADDGTAILDGTIVQASRSNPFLKQALLGLAMSYGFGLAAGQPLAGPIQLVFQLLTGASAIVAFGFIVAAFVRRRGRRKHVVVELRPHVRNLDIVDAPMIRALREEADGREAWMIAEGGFSPAALAAANAASIRCFTCKNDHFVEIRTDAPAAGQPLAA
jgi:hypothetical protein